MKRCAVVKIGGHVLFDGSELDIKYLQDLKEVLGEAAKLYDWVVVVVGGGGVARKYIAWGRELGLGEAALDVIGLRLAAVNASLLWAYFHGAAPPQVPTSVHEAVAMIPAWRVIFVGGLQPAQSTTTVAALLAEALGAEKLVIATNVDGVYDDDPKKNPRARKLEEVTCSDLEKLLSRDVMAGEYRLLDPLSIYILKRGKIDAYVVAGRPPENVLRALKGERIGTRILPSKP